MGERPCPDCDGRGVAGGKICDWCHGTGKWNEEEQNRSRYEVHPVGTAAEIARLREEAAELRKPDLRMVLGFEAGQADADALRARVAELERLVANFEAGGRVSFGDCSPEVQHRLARIAELEAALREAMAKTQDAIDTGGRIYDPAGIVDLCDRALGAETGGG